MKLANTNHIGMDWVRKMQRARHNCVSQPIDLDKEATMNLTIQIIPPVTWSSKPKSKNGKAKSAEMCPVCQKTMALAQNVCDHDCTCEHTD